MVNCFLGPNDRTLFVVRFDGLEQKRMVYGIAIRKLVTFSKHGT